MYIIHVVRKPPQFTWYESSCWAGWCTLSCLDSCAWCGICWAGWCTLSYLDRCTWCGSCWAGWCTRSSRMRTAVHSPDYPRRWAAPSCYHAWPQSPTQVKEYIEIEKQNSRNIKHTITLEIICRWSVFFFWEYRLFSIDESTPHRPLINRRKQLLLTDNVLKGFLNRLKRVYFLWI